MKKIKYLFLLMIGLSIIGCSDLIEEPIGILTPEGFFQSMNDVQIAVDGSLTHAINEKIWGRKLSIALMLRSDMVNLQSTQTRRVEMNDHTVLGSNGMMSEFWPRIYQGIAAANLAIEGAADVDAMDDEKNPVIAQAYFARAFYYFHLVRLFGDIPYVDVVITGANADEVGSMPATPAAQVYENILADLEFAKTWLPNTVDGRGIPSKAAATSYLALVYLTLGEYQNAWDEAYEVIDNKEVYNVDLDPDYQTLFNASLIDASIEPIFALDYNNFEADDNAYDQISPMCGVRGDDGWSVAVPAYEVYLSFDELDYRRAVSFQTEATINDTLRDYTEFDASGHEHAANWPYMAKYSRYPEPYARGSKRATSHNYSMMRYAEVLLIAAEAAVELGDNASATTYVNEVRARARMGGNTTSGGYTPATVPPSAVPADITGTVTVADVLEERRLEFAFECKRWYDIARRKMGEAPYEVFSASGLEGYKEFWSSDDYLLPIPEDELERNPNLGL